MTENQQKPAAQAFAKYWKDKGYEKGESQSFWLSLLRDVYGVEHPEQFILFEEQVHLDHTSFIDGFIPATKVLIEQKGLGKDLNKPIKQSDGTSLTPFQQAKRYITELPVSMHPRWVVTCNFEEFYVYDMEKPGGEPEKIQLADLGKEYYRLSFLANTGNVHLKREMEISIKAGEIVGLLYDALLKQYIDPTDTNTLKSLNKLCVRLVFCLYAEDAGIFGKHLMFHDYLAKYDAEDLSDALSKLFRVLDTKPEDRSPYLKSSLAQFPYVNGGLFADEEIEIPQLTEEIRELLLEKASENIDWSEISPTIFGAVFESTLNPETRRSGGMHYTSIENIHKVIDPLFLDELKKELAEIKEITVLKTQEKRLREFQAKLASLRFLDPAAGSGNFLTETYLSLRRLENEVIDLLNYGQVLFTDAKSSPIQVSISQFAGIEINDFAVTVAKTALWIAESQMMKETEKIVLMPLEFLPLKTNASIVEGNALQLDWETIVPKSQLNYIMGNPPFVGARLMSEQQKADLQFVFAGKKGFGNLDYVSGWYVKVAEYMKDTSIHAALVSTNSITQGEQVPLLWASLKRQGIIINFAYRTFCWDSEAKLKAHVHCVIVGFSYTPSSNCKLFFSDSTYKIVDSINSYLVSGPNIIIESRKKPLCNVNNVVFGSMPNDGGFLSDYSEEKKNSIVTEYPLAEEMFRPFLGATEFLHGKKRWCLWLQGVSPADIKKVRPVMDAISSVKTMRENSNRKETQKLADVPYLFGEIRQPNDNYIIIPRHTSENRKYIPMGFISPDIICGDSNLLLPNADLYQFGVLMSNVHNSWVSTVCGRIKSDYRYSVNVVYNNFPWPEPTEEQRAKIEQTAQGILDARALYPDSSLADIYDELTMPPELRKAHQQNDRAVMQAYGLPIKETTESTCVAALMKLYQDKTN